MTKFIVGLAIFSMILAAWVVWIRPWMRDKPWAAGFFAWIEPVERNLWRKSETILWARVKMLVGVLLTALTQIGAIDITPIMPLVPDEYEPLFKTVFGLLPLIITLMGWVDEKLREDTTKPIEVVALPDIKPPEVAAAIAKAEVATVKAVAAVKADEVKVAAAAAAPPKGSA